MHDLGPAANQLAALLPEATGERLGQPTPCADMTVGDLLDHLMGLTLAFRCTAEKTGEELTGSPPPPPSAATLDPDWRILLPRRLEELAASWRRPEAWQGMTQAGGQPLPAEVAGVIALDELVMHGWDLARALDLPYEIDSDSVDALLGFLEQTADDEADREGLFGPVVDVPADASTFDRALGLAGRDPAWTPPN